MNNKKFIKQIETEVTNWLTTIGFIRDRYLFNVYVKNSTNYRDLLLFNYEITENEIIVDLQSFARDLKLIDSYFEQYINNPIIISDYIKMNLNGSDKRTNHKVLLADIKSETVEQMCAKIKTDYYEIVAPLLDEYSNINKLDEVANGNDKTFSIGNEKYFRKLIIARLAGNSNYENIYKEITEMYKKIIIDEPSDDYYKNTLWVIEQIYKKLKNVFSLENPNLI